MDLKLAAGVCIVKAHKILLLREADSGRWGPPAGHAKPDEDPIKTAIRETKEETNLDVTIIGLVQATYILKSKDVHYLALFYKAIIDGSETISPQPNEVSEFGWFSKEEIENLELRDILLKPIFKKAIDDDIASLETFQIRKTTEYK